MATNYAPEKPQAEFYKNPRYLDGLFSYCIPCHSEKGKAWRANNAERFRASVRKNQAAYLERNLRIVLDHVALNPCVDCGESDPLVLEFDHVRGEKLFEIGEQVEHRNPDKLKAEMAKCDVRCANCHRRVTLKRRGTAKYRMLRGD